MISADILPPLYEIVDASKIRVHNPTDVIFVCGGRYDVESATPCSFRDLFMRQAANEKLPSASYILAEDLNAFFPQGNYSDILTLERDLAQMSDLIVLFSESYGSAAELGAFAMSDEIAKRLAVFIDNKNYNDNSFVKLGPLRVLQNNYSESAVCVLNLEYLNINNTRNLTGINVDKFTYIVSECIQERRKTVENRSTLSKSTPGHIAKLAVGVIQIYGALDISEIYIIISYMGIDISELELSNLLLCASFVNWIKIEQVGVRKFYIAAVEKRASSLPFQNGSQVRKAEFEAIIREYWKSNDALRFSCIGRAALELAKRA